MTPSALALAERAAWAAMYADPTFETHAAWSDTRAAIADYLRESGQASLECWVAGVRYSSGTRGQLRWTVLERSLPRCSP